MMEKHFFTSYPKTFQRIVIVVMVLALFTPLLAMRFHVKPFIQTQENRELAKQPVFSVRQWNIFPTQFEQYFNDNFGLRSDLVYLNAVGKVGIHTSTTDQVAIGKSNWLFYVDGLTYVDSIHGQPFTPTELDQIKKNLTAINSYFMQKNIKFYFIVAPNSQTIYHNQTPRSMQFVHPQSRLDQLNQLLDDQKTVAYVNVEPQLLQAKQHEQVYYKDDTHWNYAGAFVAYQALMDRIHQDVPDLSPTQKSAYTVSYQYTDVKDLEALLGLQDFYNDKEPIFTPKTKPTVRVVRQDCSLVYSAALCPMLTYENPTQSHKLVMFRDSFAVGLFPFLPQHFSRSVFQWTDTFNTTLIDKEQPDIVIWELTERNLWELTSGSLDTFFKNG